MNRYIIPTLAILMMLIAGCGKTVTETNTTINMTTEPEACGKECFAKLANDCQPINITVDETYGTMNYSEQDCVFTKTVIKLTDNETQQIRNLFRAKSLACNYTKGNFDTRWTNSLVEGLEYCDGKLKDLIADMLAIA